MSVSIFSVFTCVFFVLVCLTVSSCLSIDICAMAYCLSVGHCFVHKWLLLTDPNDAQSGPRGYLKMSIMLLGPGDEPVVRKEIN